MSYEAMIHDMTDYEIIRNSYIRAAFEEQEHITALPEPEDPVTSKLMTEEQYRRVQLIGAFVVIIGMPIMSILFGN